MKRDSRKRKRKKEKLLSKKEKRINLVARVTKQVDKVWETEIRESSMREEENRKKAIFFFWRKWKDERNNKDSTSQ